MDLSAILDHVITRTGCIKSCLLNNNIDDDNDDGDNDDDYDDDDDDYNYCYCYENDIDNKDDKDDNDNRQPFVLFHSTRLGYQTIV